MGTVVLAEDTRLGRHVALKTVSGAQAGTAGGRAQLLDEARAAAALTHPAIAAVHDVIEHDGDIAIVFEFVEGETLAARLAKGAAPRRPGDPHRRADCRRAGVAHGHQRAAPRPEAVERDAGAGRRREDPRLRHRALPAGRRPRRRRRRRRASSARPATSRRSSGSADRPTNAPISTRWAWCSSRCSPASGRSPSASRSRWPRASIDRIARRVSSLRPDVSPGARSAGGAAARRRPGAASAARPRRRRRTAPAAGAAGAAPGAAAGAAWPRRGAGRVTLGAAGVWCGPRPVRLDVRNPGHRRAAARQRHRRRANDYLAAGVADSLVTSLASLPTVTVLSRAAVDEPARAARIPPRRRPRSRRDLRRRRHGAAGRRSSCGWRSTCCARTARWPGPKRSKAGPEMRLRRCRRGWPARSASALERADVERRISARLSTPPTSNANALDAYWRGRALLERRDTPGNLQRVAVGVQARRCASTPASSMPTSALGETFWALYNTTRDRAVGRAGGAGQPERRAAGARQPAVRLALGVTLTNSGRNREAVQELQRALAAEPNHDEARRNLGKRARGARPPRRGGGRVAQGAGAAPQQLAGAERHGPALYQAARYDEAEQAYRQLVTLQPDNVVGIPDARHRAPGAGPNDEALAFYEQAIAIAPVAQALSNMGAHVPRAAATSAGRRRLPARHRAAAQRGADASQPRRLAAAARAHAPRRRRPIAARRSWPRRPAS